MYGKLGHGNEAGHSTPKRVEGLIGLPVTQIACGSRHTAVVTAQGALYSWGDRENGVSGHGSAEGHQLTPRLVDRLAGKRVVQLSVRSENLRPSGVLRAPFLLRLVDSTMVV